MGKLNWEAYEGEFHAYLQDGTEVVIGARSYYSRWGESDSLERDWVVRDEDSRVIAEGRAANLREAKSAVIRALDL